MVFIGSMNVWYDKRRSCVREVARGLMLAHTNGTEPAANVTMCSKYFCQHEQCAASCRLQLRGHLLSDQGWTQELSSASTFLNVHKACYTNRSQSDAACESFRLAPLLSAGAMVFSEHCHRSDEREYTGLVHFAPVVQLGAAAVASWRQEAIDGIILGPRKRAAAFAERFAPAVIFERAGITAMLAAHRAGDQRNWNGFRGTSHDTNRSVGPTLRRPAYCRNSGRNRTL